MSFYQRKEIKDLLAYLKLLVNIKDDVSFTRVVNYPKRGIGQKTIADMTELARRDGKSLYEIAGLVDQYPGLSGKAKRIGPFIALMEKYRGQIADRPVDLVTQDLVSDLNLIQELLAEDQATGQTRVDNVEAFIEGAAEYARGHPTATLAEYLAEISLYTDIDNFQHIEDKLTLMTLHAAKGLEFETVYLVGLEEGLFPLQRTTQDAEQLEEERRLFYVGATRACKRLILSSARARFRFGEVESAPSRFIKEIPGQLVDVKDYRSQHVFAQRTGQPSFLPKDRRQVAEPGELEYEYEGAHGFEPNRIVMHPTFRLRSLFK